MTEFTSKTKLYSKVLRSKNWKLSSQNVSCVRIIFSDIQTRISLINAATIFHEQISGSVKSVGSLISAVFPDSKRDFYDYVAAIRVHYANGYVESRTIKVRKRDDTLASCKLANVYVPGDSRKFARDFPRAAKML